MLLFTLAAAAAQVQVRHRNKFIKIIQQQHITTRDHTAGRLRFRLPQKNTDIYLCSCSLFFLQQQTTALSISPGMQQQQQQLQHLMQMQQQQPIMSSSAYYPNNVTTDHIQQYLDENKSLILKIVESQNSGKMSECAENQARLQQNLMYLAAIADSHHQPPALQAQYAPSSIIQPGSLDMQHPQAQQMPPQSLTVARSSMLYNSQQQQQQQQPYSTLQQQQSVHNQLSMNSGFHMLQGNNASSNTHMYSVFGREIGGGEGQHSGGSHNSHGN